MSELRFVFDTNVGISAALLEASVPGRALTQAFYRGAILFSLATFTELTEVLYRPKFQRYLDPEERDEFIPRLFSGGVRIEIAVKINICRDPKDNKFLELAVSGQATHIITGDADLLVLHPFHGISILKPAELLAELLHSDN